MYDIADAMKHNSKVNAFSARTMRHFEVKMTAKARKFSAKGKNTGGFSVRRELCYAERITLRKEQRMLHLARAMLKGQAYSEVEQATREGNEPKAEYLFHELRMWDVTNLSLAEVREWLTL